MIQFNQDKAPGVTSGIAEGLAAVADLPAAGAGAVHATHRAHGIVAPQELLTARQLRGTSPPICDGVNLRNEVERWLEKDGHPRVAAVSDWITTMRTSPALGIDIKQCAFVI